MSEMKSFADRPNMTDMILMTDKQVQAYNVQEVQWCGAVQIPVQLVQDDPLHPQNL